MNSTNLMNAGGKGPAAKARSGRFEVSIWHWTKIIPARPEVRDFFPERQIELQRACIRYSTWNKYRREWQQACIWCNAHDIRSLAQALDKLDSLD